MGRIIVATGLYNLDSVSFVPLLDCGFGSGWNSSNPLTSFTPTFFLLLCLCLQATKPNSDWVLFLLLSLAVLQVEIEGCGATEEEAEGGAVNGRTGRDGCRRETTAGISGGGWMTGLSRRRLGVDNEEKQRI